MTEDESVSEYNERVLEIANDSLLLGEKIHESKIVCKVLRSLPRKFVMKVTAIEEAQDITTLKLDELFGSLLTFEMALSNKESKKGKGIAFKLLYDQETTANQSGNEANQDESIALLTKQFSKMAKKFKSLNTAGKTEKTGRHDGENSTRKVNDFSYRRNSDHGRKKEDGRTVQVNMASDLILKLEVSRLRQKKGHTRSFCYKLLRDRRHQQKSKLINQQNNCRLTKRNNNVRGTAMIWRVKTSENCNVAFTTVQTHVDAWYFDSGCSRHMTGNQSFFTELEECASGHVTFGDGAKGKIIAKGNIDKSNLPCLNEVRYVDELEANLMSISQLCDQGYNVNINNTGCVVTDKNNQVFMNGRREADNSYHWSSNSSNICHLTKINQTWLWYRKLGHISLRSLDKVIRNEAVVGIPSLDINGKNFCGDYQVGKQTKTSYRRLKKYVLVVVDDYSRFTWVRFLKGKSDTVKLCINICLNLQREKGQKIIKIRSDHGKEFDNEDLNNFCQTEGIHHEFVAPITPQQNGVVKRKNRMVTTQSSMTATLYELWKGKKPNVKYFHIFGSTCYILADREYHRKWDVKSDQWIFLGYSQNSRAYRVFNIKSETVMEKINVVVNDFESNVNQFNIEDDETHVTPDVTYTPLDEMPKGDLQPDSAKTNSNITDEVINNETVLIPSAHVKKNHPSSSIIGDPSTGITTRRKEKVDYAKMIADLCYVSAIEPTSVENALKDEYWINVMQEELLQFKHNSVWTLVPKPDGANIIGTKWIFKNKTDEYGSVIRNKAR
ncbi:gag-pol polyprotein [Cucumis melo var. makuwa]|uniref:Gag-pol polyprotein n=1 Tax=Cucumis melo var. makuwa TaxID=1194695 RepID=A0A5A7TQU8_CUCMM|nr:gag-pol polyprotein [Cucumis melo var. makuwa]TYK19274.1 gag-pol polyprotein [Cucumis melo var. makuwa]